MRRRGLSSACLTPPPRTTPSRSLAACMCSTARRVPRSTAFRCATAMCETCPSWTLCAAHRMGDIGAGRWRVRLRHHRQHLLQAESAQPEAVAHDRQRRAAGVAERAARHRHLHGGRAGRDAPAAVGSYRTGALPPAPGGAAGSHLFCEHGHPVGQRGVQPHGARFEFPPFTFFTTPDGAARSIPGGALDPINDYDLGRSTLRSPAWEVEPASSLPTSPRPVSEACRRVFIRFNCSATTAERFPCRFPTHPSFR